MLLIKGLQHEGLHIMSLQGDDRVLRIVENDIIIYVKSFTDWSLRILKCDIGVMNMDCAVLHQTINYGLCSVKPDY